MCAQVVAEWLREVAVASRRYKDELLSAVLDLLLSAPPSVLRHTVQHSPCLPHTLFRKFADIRNPLFLLLLGATPRKDCSGWAW